MIYLSVHQRFWYLATEDKNHFYSGGHFLEQIVLFLFNFNGFHIRFFPKLVKKLYSLAVFNFGCRLTVGGADRRRAAE